MRSKTSRYICTLEFVLFDKLVNVLFEVNKKVQMKIFTNFFIVKSRWSINWFMIWMVHSFKVVKWWIIFTYLSYHSHPYKWHNPTSMPAILIQKYSDNPLFSLCWSVLRYNKNFITIPHAKSSPKYFHTRIINERIRIIFHWEIYIYFEVIKINEMKNKL